MSARKRHLFRPVAGLLLQALQSAPGHFPFSRAFSSPVDSPSCVSGDPLGMSRARAATRTSRRGSRSGKGERAPAGTTSQGPRDVFFLSKRKPSVKPASHVTPTGRACFCVCCVARCVRLPPPSHAYLQCTPPPNVSRTVPFCLSPCQLRGGRRGYVARKHRVAPAPHIPPEVESPLAEKCDPLLKRAARALSARAPSARGHVRPSDRPELRPALWRASRERPPPILPRFPHPPITPSCTLAVPGGRLFSL